MKISMLWFLAVDEMAFAVLITIIPDSVYQRIAFLTYNIFNLQCFIGDVNIHNQPQDVQGFLRVTSFYPWGTSMRMNGMFTS